MSRNILINNLRCCVGQQKYGVNLGGDFIIKKLYNSKMINNIRVKNIEFLNNHFIRSSINGYKQKINRYVQINDGYKQMINSYEQSINGYTKIITKNTQLLYISNNGYSQTYDSIFNSIDNKFCLNIGGDHSIGAATIQPLLDIYNDDLLVIWIDAHADVNTYETSLTQNKHGMPIAPLLGLMEHWYSIGTNINHHKLKPENLLYIGIRDLDPEEANLIDKLNIKHFVKYSNEIDNWIKNHKASKIHISFDIDSIDPEYMPSTGTPVSDGLLIEDVNQIIKLSNDKLISLDIVEYNPCIGTLTEQQQTLNNIIKIIKKCNIII